MMLRPINQWFQNRDDKEFFLLNPENSHKNFVWHRTSISKQVLITGMSAVADVVLNRVDDRRYPDTVCDVVYDAVMKESWKTKQHKDPQIINVFIIQYVISVSSLGSVTVNPMMSLRFRELGTCANGCMGNDARRSFWDHRR